MKSQVNLKIRSLLLALSTLIIVGSVSIANCANVSRVSFEQIRVEPQQGITRSRETSIGDRSAPARPVSKKPFKVPSISKSGVQIGFRRA